MYVSFLFVDLFPLYLSPKIIVFFFYSPPAPSSCYLLTPADLGRFNGRAGKADEVTDG